MNSETSENVRSAFIDIIKNLEPIDVKILEYCYMRYRKERTERIAKSKESPWHRVGDSIDYPVSMDDITKAMGISETQYKTSVDNLIRTRLLASYIEESEIQSNIDGTDHWFEASLHYGYYSVCMTHLGISFVVVCTAASEDEDECEFLERLRSEQEEKRHNRDAAIRAALEKIEEQFEGSAVMKVDRQDK